MAGCYGTKERYLNAKWGLWGGTPPFPSYTIAIKVGGIIGGIIKSYIEYNNYTSMSYPANMNAEKEFTRPRIIFFLARARALLLHKHYYVSLSQGATLVHIELDNIIRRDCR
jgi:hypothetical protein